MRASIDSTRQDAENAGYSENENKSGVAKGQKNYSTVDELVKKQLEEEKVNAGKVTQAQLEGLAMEIKTLQQESQEAQRQLDLATTRADRDGVLTWVVLEEGSAVNKGDVIARIADLNSFRVDAKNPPSPFVVQGET